MFIYIDPGVDWTFDLSVLGNRPVTVGSSTLNIRGGSAAPFLGVAGPGSALVINGASTNEWLGGAAGALIFFQNISLSIPDTASFPTTNPIQNVVFDTGAILISTSTGTGPVFDFATVGVGATSGVYQFHANTFIGSGAAIVMFSDVPDGMALVITDCTLAGSWSSFNLAVAFGGNLGRIQVNGIRMSQTNTPGILIGQRDAGLPTGQVTVSQMQDVEGGTFPDTNITPLNGALISNSSVGTVVFSGDNNRLDNVIANTGIPPGGSGSNNTCTNCQFGSPSGGASNVFSPAGPAAVDNVFSGCTIHPLMAAPLDVSAFIGYEFDSCDFTTNGITSVGAGSSGVGQIWTGNRIESGFVIAAPYAPVTGAPLMVANKLTAAGTGLAVPTNSHTNSIGNM
jgi:hypothetical protein